MGRRLPQLYYRKDEKKSRKEKSSTQFSWHLLGSVVFSFAVTKEVWPLLLATLLWSRRIGVHQVLYVFALLFFWEEDWTQMSFSKMASSFGVMNS